MAVHESVSDAIGNTPLIRLARLGAELATPIYAKVEFLSVGGSVKDRAALSMIDAAERDGVLRPGGTIIEASSGNTGIGLVIVGRQRGYRVVVGVSDKSAQEKLDILTAYGAEVVTASSSLPKQHPDHLFNVVRRLADEIPDAWLANQYDNPANPDAHVRTTGPELWTQTGGRITHLVAGVGTGGTITGTGRYLKDVSAGAVTVVGADPDASIYGGGDGSAYYVESIGHFVHPETAEDHWPEAYDRGVVDRFERIGDRESLLTARRLAREEGLLAGPSSGTAVAAALRIARDLGPDDLVVVVLPDSGRSYLSKVFSDDWLRRWGFLEDATGAFDALGSAPVPVIASTVTVADAALLPDAPAVSVVLPRRDRPHGLAAGEIVGSVRPAVLAAAVSEGRIAADSPVSDHLDAPLPTVGVGQSVHDARTALGDDGDALLVLRDGRAVAVLTRAGLAAAST